MKAGVHVRARLLAEQLAAACLLVFAAAATSTAQTEADVREAVANVFTPDGSRERLAEWGDAAVPFLAAMVEHPDPEDLAAFKLRAAVRLIGTCDAAQILIALLEHEGRMRFLQDFVLEDLEVLAADPDRRGCIEGERLKAAVLAHADGDSDPATLHDVDDVIGLIAHMGWTDQAPRLEALLDHDGADVRAAAADALEVLTGERPDHDPLPLSFAAEVLDERLVELLGTRPCDDALLSPCFASWRGAHHLLFPAGREGLVVLDESLDAVQTHDLGGDVRHVVVTSRSEGGQQAVCMVSVGSSEPEPWLVALDEEGQELWRRTLGRGSVHALVPLYGAASGFLAELLPAGGERSLVAFDRDGTERWSRPAKPYDPLELVTHPGLGELVGVVGDGKLHLLDGSGEPFEGRRDPISSLLRGVAGAVSVGQSPEPPAHFLSEALLLPPSGGRVAQILAGRDHDEGVPFLARRNARSRLAWIARLPDDVTGLCLLEPEGAPRWIVALTLSGEMLVADEHGTLLYRGRFAETRLTHGATDRMALPLAFRGGRLGDGLAFVVVVREEARVYRVD